MHTHNKKPSMPEPEDPHLHAVNRGDVAAVDRAMRKYAAEHWEKWSWGDGNNAHFHRQRGRPSNAQRADREDAARDAEEA